jgi:hypothetical protein
MKATEIIKQLKQVFNDLQNTGAETPKPEEKKEDIKMAKLKDGTEIQVTELAVGGIVTINGTPAPAGEHILEDGTAIYIGDNGVITEIKTKKEEVEEPMAKTTEEDMGQKEMKYAEEFAKFQSETNEKFNSYETKFAQYEERLAKAVKVIDGLLNLTQTLADTPTGQPDSVVKSSNNFNEDKVKSYDILFS